MAEIVNFVGNIKNILLDLGPNIAIILIILAGITFGLSYTQPASNRGQWQTVAMGLFIGGIIVAALTGAAETIASTSKTFLL